MRARAARRFSDAWTGLARQLAEGDANAALSILEVQAHGFARGAAIGAFIMGVMLLAAVFFALYNKTAWPNFWGQRR